MSDNSFDRPEAPAGWDQYASILKEMPVHQAPANLYNRIDARLSAGNMPKSRNLAVKWVLIPAMALLALICGYWISGAGRNSAMKTPQMAVPVANDAATNGQRNLRRNGRRMNPPMIGSTDTALQIDTTILLSPSTPATSEDPVVPGVRPTQRDRNPHSSEATTGGAKREP